MTSDLRETVATKHTPTPWAYKKVENGCTAVHAKTLLAKVYSENFKDLENETANAAFIVRACNSHDALVNALDQAVTSMQDSGYQNDHIAVMAARQALALAKEV